MSLAEDLAKELGPEPGATPKRGRSSHSSEPSVFKLANEVETTRVLDWLSIEHDEKFARCPGCGEENAKICNNGGLKCLHDRCSTAGVPGMPGFRTNVHLAQHVRGVEALQAAKDICERFGIPIPERKQAPADDDYIPEPPEWFREPGDDTEEIAAELKEQQREAGKPDPKPDELAPRLLTYKDLLDTSGARALKRERVITCTTGHYKLDDVTGGIKPGFVWLVGADTSWGKSSLLVMVADENLKRGKKTLIVSAEDDESLYGDRLLVRRSRVRYSAFQRGRLTEAEQDAVRKQMARGEPLPVYLDGRGRTIEKLCKQIEATIKKHDIDLVALDYLQALDNERRQQDKRNQITYIARKFTDVVKAHGKAGLIMSQITRNEQNAKKHPDKHSIRDSRDVSNGAEVVLLGFEPDSDVVRKDGTLVAKAGSKVVLLDKCKDGQRGGMYPMAWNAEQACFDITPDPMMRRYDDLAGDDWERGL